MLISALSQGLLYAPMALGVFITFRILKTPDLTVDGSFVFGMTASAAVTIAGHPVLALFVGAAAGALLCQQQRYADLNCGSSILVMGLASVIIGQVLFGDRGMVGGLISAVGAPWCTEW